MTSARGMGSSAMLLLLWLPATAAAANASIEDFGLPNCSSTHMRCPVPPHSAGTYFILGSENKSTCSMQSAGGQPFFKFPIGDCNMTRTINRTASLVIDEVTIVHRPPNYGQLIIGPTPTFSMVHCACESPMTAVAASGQIEFAPLPGFNASLKLHLTDAFDAPLGSGELVAEASERLYVEVSTPNPAHLIGILECIASPTGEIDDPFTVNLLDKACPVEAQQDLQVVPENETHTARFSLRKFKFASVDSVYIWCTVARCFSEPCGECQTALVLANAETTNKVGFRMAPSDLVMPGPVDGGIKVLWEREPSWPSGSIVLRTNVTLFGRPSDLSEEFLDVLADTTALGLGSRFERQVQILRIMAATGPQERRLAAADGTNGTNGTLMEALIEEAAIAVNRVEELTTVESTLETLATDREEASEFAGELLADLASQNVSGLPHVLATFNSTAVRMIPKRGGGVYEIVGSVAFRAVIRVYPTNAFNNPLGPGDVFPRSSSRLHLQIASTSRADVIGLLSCIASPTSAINDPFAVPFLEASCPTGPLNVKVHPEDKTHIVRISVKSFKFAGSPGVYVWCTVARCLSEPCGQCTSSRRLQVDVATARRLQAGGALTQVWFRAQASEGVAVLPGPVSISRGPLIIWEKPIELPSRQLSVQTNVTLYGYPADLSPAFLDAMADSVASTLGLIFVHEVRILRILAFEAAPHERLLSWREAGAADISSVEALMAETAIIVERKEEREMVEAKLAALIRDDDAAASFAQSLQMELSRQNFGSMNSLQATFGPASIVNMAATILPAVDYRPLSNNPDELRDTEFTVRFAAATAGVFSAVGCLGVSLAAVWWQMRRRRGLASNHQREWHLA